MAHALWSGSITFGLVNIPVQLFSAEKPSAQVHLHLLDRKTHTRIHNLRVNEHGAEVPWEQIDHAYEFNKGKYVIVDQKMLEKTAAQNFETIDIDCFVPSAQIDPIYFEKPYFLIPGAQGSKGYALLHEILKDNAQVGIANIVIRTRQHIAAIVPSNDHLMLIILRYAKELHKAADFVAKCKTKAKPKPTAVKITAKERALAQQLIAKMSGKWKPEQYTDDNKELLQKLINASIKKGKTVSSKAKPVAKGAKIVDFAELLQQSVQKRGTPKPRAKRKS